MKLWLSNVASPKNAHLPQSLGGFDFCSDNRQALYYECRKSEFPCTIKYSNSKVIILYYYLNIVHGMCGGAAAFEDAMMMVPKSESWRRSWLLKFTSHYRANC